MKARPLLKKLVWVFCGMGFLLIFVVWDWLPTVKDMNRFRREQRDEMLKIKNMTTLDFNFVFPDAEEKSFFAETNIRLRRSLPQMHDDDAWLAMAMLELQARVRENRMASALILMTHHAIGAEFDVIKPGRPAELADWVTSQYWEIQESFGIAWDPGRYPWRGIFSGVDFIGEQMLVSRPLMVALAAPLPALLDFINRISWGEARLEIVRLHLEPGMAMSRAWLICRGSYLVRRPSAWRLVPVENTAAGDDLLIDGDSPLLWLPVDPAVAGPTAKKELAPGTRAAATR